MRKKLNILFHNFINNKQVNKTNINDIIRNINKFIKNVSKKYITRICDNCLDNDYEFYCIEGCNNKMILCS